MKKIIIICIVLLSLTGCNKEKSVNNAIVNNNENIISEKTIGDYTINNVSLIYENGLSTFTAFVNNNLEETKLINEFKVIFKNENGNIITTLDGPKMEIEANKYFVVTITSDIDLSEAYEVEYQMK